MEYAKSADGTTIAYERTGSGPPLVLVHGSLNDRYAWSLVRPAFEERFAVYAIDRRGRGESGAPAEHAIERQFEDVAAVIKAIGEPVDLIGHSYGAHCALGAAVIAPDRVKHLVLYEPPSPALAQGGAAEMFETLPPSEALEAFFTRIGTSPEEIALAKTTPYWAYSMSFTKTMPTEGGALAGYEFDPVRFASLKMPTLFLAGSESAEGLTDVMRQLQPHMPQAEYVTFEGQGHGAILLAPKLFSDVVLEFLAR